MYECKSCTCCPLPLAETEYDIQADCNKSKEQREYCTHCHILRNSRTNLICRNNTINIVLCIAETVKSNIVSVKWLQSVVENGLNLLGSSLRSIIELVLSNDTHLVLCTILLNLQRSSCSITLYKGILQSATNLLCRYILVETNYECTTTGELNAIVQAVEYERSNTCEDYYTRSDVSPLTLADEVEVEVGEQVLRPLVRERNLAPLCNDSLNQQTSDENRAEQRSEDTDNESSCEALNRTITEYEENDTGDDSGQVTIDNCRVSVRETVLDSSVNTLTTTQLLLDTLVDNYVSIYRHTHCQNDTCDTRQGQYCTERYEAAHQKEYIGNQSDIRYPTCCTIEQAHIEEYEDKRQEE